MAKDILTRGEDSTNYIQQIAAGENTYDIATKNSIIFYNGQADDSGIEWNGVAPLEVVIPSVTDIVQDPVRMVGTSADGTIPVQTPQKGDLVYITAPCTYAGIVCEAGDMAIYDGTAWRVIQGENQVSFPGSADASGHIVVALSETPVDVLDVEGKSLYLGLDYADIRSNVGVVFNSTAAELSVTNGTVAVSAAYLALSKAADSSVDITVAKSIDLPTNLADGSVAISQSVLVSDNFTFTSGSYPTITKNASPINVEVNNPMTIGKTYDTDGTSGDYLTSVSAIKAVTFVNGDESTHDIKFVSGFTTDTAKTFVSAIHAWTQADAETTPDFTVYGAVTNTGLSSFVSGFSAEASTGDLVSSISVGAVTIDSAGTGILTGLTSGVNTVVTSVSMGTVEQDSTKQWFLTGLGEAAASGDVVSSITIGATSLIADNGSAFAGSAMTSASVNNHVLSFSTGSFMTPVALSKAADTINYKSFNKGGVKLSGFDSTATTFTSGAISQADTTVSYKSPLSGVVTLSQDSTKYYLDKENEHAYAPVYGYKTINTTEATVTKNTPKLANTNITASIAANTVGVDVTSGTLPTLSIASPTGTLTGTVGTALTTVSVSWLAVDDSLAEIPIPGAYTLISADSAGDNTVTVAKSADYAVESGKITIPVNTFIVDVTVDGSSVQGS